LTNILKIKKMGHIKEPKGVDFVINGEPLTKEEDIAISNYIKSYKAKHSSKPTTVKKTVRRLKNRKKVSA
jgi:hypothetical protein